MSRVTLVDEHGEADFSTATDVWTRLVSVPVDAWSDNAHLSLEGSEGWMLVFRTTTGWLVSCCGDSDDVECFLRTGCASNKSIRILLAGQEEQLPAQLFVDAGTARLAVEHFARFGERAPGLEWIRINEAGAESLVP